MADPRHQRDLDATASENPYAESTTPSTTDRPAATTRRARLTRVAAPIAALAVASTAVLAATASADDSETSASEQVAITGAISAVADRRVEQASRSGARTDDPKTLADNPRKLQRAYNRADRRTATYLAVEGADTKRWTTANLNLWTLPGKKAEKVGLLAEEKRVLVTGRSQRGRDEVVVNGKSRWVTAGYLAKQKPEPEPEPEPKPAAQSSEPTQAEDNGGTCSNGTSLSPGVSPNLHKVHEMICANFPEITSYGDFRSDGEHGQGRAVDAMVSGERGWQVAEMVRANAGELGVEYVIYAQKIWSVDRASEGWRWMSDRGSATANHYDHVHVTVY